MKTFNKYAGKMMAMAMTIMFAMSITSCEAEWWDDNHRMDYKQSKALSGQWTGDFGMYYTYNGRAYDANYTDIVFYPEYSGATYGWGKEVDFYAFGPVEYVYHKFDWKLRDGVVDLMYYRDDYLNTFIRDYNMNNDYFQGYFGNTDDRFSLRKIKDYYDWTPYVDTYSSGNRRDWYDARQMIDLDDSTSTKQLNGEIIFGRRIKAVEE